MSDATEEQFERQRGFKDETTFARMQRLFEERIKQEQEEAEMWSRGEVYYSSLYVNRATLIP